MAVPICCVKKRDETREVEDERVDRAVGGPGR
jgi:hypothetical protein